MKKAALITGGARRIGRSIAAALAGRGFDIALHCRNSEAEAEAAARAIRRLGVECEVFACDLADPAVPEALVEAVRLRFPRCRLLVNNASVFERGGYEETGRERFDRVWAINFNVPFFLTQAFVSVFPRGHVVNLCDAKVEREFTSHFAYALSKKSVLAFTRMAAKALGPRFRVNAVAPGLILPSSEFDEAALSKLSRRLPLRRKGEAADVASAVLFLEENSYLTGECIFVDGGEHLH